MKKGGMYSPRGLAISERLMARRVVAPQGCWEWTGHRTPRGYGRIQIAQVGPRLVHRVAWETFVGPIPEDRPEIDHLCRNPPCFNPDHLEPVTSAENMRRRAAAWVSCRRGHDLTQPGAIHYRKDWALGGPRGARECTACRALRYQAVAA